MRERTEWIKTVKDGWNILIGADKEKIVKMANEFKPNKRQRNVFGDGEANKKNCRDNNGLKREITAKGFLYFVPTLLSAP